MIDRFILRSVNLGIFVPEEFEIRDDGCRMTLDCKKKWFQKYEEYLGTPMQEFQGQTPKQFIRFQIEKFGMFIFDQGIIAEDGEEGCLGS